MPEGKCPPALAGRSPPKKFSIVIKGFQMNTLELYIDRSVFSRFKYNNQQALSETRAKAGLKTAK